MSDFDRIDEVVAHSLCVRCGTCAGICPTNAIIFDEKDFPNIDLDTCTNCGLCIQVCPGYDVNFPELYSRLFDDTSGLQTLTGNFDDVFCAYATEESIRRNGAGGGVVTQLLAYLLEKKEVGSAVVVRHELMTVLIFFIFTHFNTREIPATIITTRSTFPAVSLLAAAR